MTTKVFTVSEMVAAEKAADASGVSYDMMMEIAGRSVSDAIIERVSVQDQKILILVGPGNNGGDGLVAGRYLAQAGADVVFFLYKPRDPQKDHNYAKILEMALPVIEAQADQGYEQLNLHLRNSNLIIDALLGTGVTRPIGGNLASVFEEVGSMLNEQSVEPGEKHRLTSVSHVGLNAVGRLKPFITAVDCPSGLNCDTGELDPLAITADLTVTFAGPKRGHFRFPGAAACGELVVADIDISPGLEVVADVPLTLATPNLVREMLPIRASDGHKGSFGTALIAAGSAHYWGAPVLAAQGAYRVGAGLVALAVPDAIRNTVAGQLPEATYPPMAAGGLLDEKSGAAILEMIGSVKAILVGPGLGHAEAFMRFLMGGMCNLYNRSQFVPPLVIDADGLNLLTGIADWQKKLPGTAILTPHPGEMARLMGISLAELRTADRVEIAREQAQEWGHIVILKGAYTVVASPDRRGTIMPFANPLLAVGGSGDVLAGVIVGLLAQAVAPYEAAVLGAYIHGAAAEMASAAEYGDSGMLSGELAQWIPRVRRRLLTANKFP